MNRRHWLFLALLAAVVSAGCFLVSGQFLVSFNFPDPLTVVSSSTLTGVPVDLNTISAYKDHKSDLKDVSDLALLGDITNLSANPTNVEVWMVPTPGALLTSDTAVRGATSAVRIWGPTTVAGNATLHVTWDASAKLFGGRQALIDQVKGDGRFDLYALGTGDEHFRINKGALLLVVSAGK